jgi:acyl-CoA thioesterase-1
LATLTATTRLLFIGDSITEVGWQDDPEQLGYGYVRLIRDQLAARDPASAPVVVNRGISAHQIPHLQARWQRDVLDLAPDIVSIYIGINDVYHGLMPGGAGCDMAGFVAGYRDIVGRTRQALPNATIVLCEPSVLWIDEHPTANARLKPYVQLVGHLAREIGATLVGLHDGFERARAARPDIPWTTDGIHPSGAGHMLVAHLWLRAMDLL